MATIAPPLAPVPSTGNPSRRVLYPHAQWYFLGAMVLTWLGFSRTYFFVIRTAPLLNHIHGMLMGGWIALLVIQPMLYQRGRIRLHRALGRWAVYLWVPAMVVCGFLTDRRMLQTHSVPPSILDQLAYLDLSSLILFPLLIALSIAYRRDLQLHARYIVCTVLLLLPPALGRILGAVPGIHTFKASVNLANALVLIVALMLVVDDRRRGRFRAPYPLFAAALGLLAITANFARGWAWWQTLAGWIAGT